MRNKNTKRNECFCTECGWRGDPDNLLFDLSGYWEQLVDSLELGVLEKKNQNTAKDILKSIAPIKKLFMISTCDLKNLAQNGCFRLHDNKADSVLELVEKAVSSKLYNIGAETLDCLMDSVEEALSQSVGMRLVAHPDNAEIITQVIVGSANYSRRYCPDCYSQVSGYAGVYEEIVISLFGGPRVSKTTTVCSTIWSIHNLQDKRTFSILSDTDHSLYTKWSVSSDLLSKYANNEKIDATPTDDNAQVVKCSFLIIVRGRKRLVSFVDIPGELVRAAADHEDESNWRKLNEKYLKLYGNLDYLWVCVDKKVLQQESSGFIPSINDEDKSLSSYGYDNTPLPVCGLMAALQQMLPHMTRLKGTAVIWGKIDQDYLTDPEKCAEPFMFKALADYNKHLYAVTKYPAVRSNAVLQQAEFIKSELTCFPNASILIDELRRLCNGKLCLFATSNYGHEPGKKEVVSPFNVLLPIAWTLAMAGAMEIEIDVRRRTKLVFAGSDADIVDLLCV